MRNLHTKTRLGLICMILKILLIKVSENITQSEKVGGLLDPIVKISLLDDLICTTYLINIVAIQTQSLMLVKPKSIHLVSSLVFLT